MIGPKRKRKRKRALTVLVVSSMRKARYKRALMRRAAFKRYKGWMSLPAVAARYGVSRRTLARWIKRGLLRSKSRRGVYRLVNPYHVRRLLLPS